MKKYILIINPKAGSAKVIEPDLADFFRQHNIKLDVKHTNKPLDAKRFAKQAVNRYSVVIAAGGDGTINEVINGIANSSTKLGIIPLGTENALAQALKIPSNHEKAAKLIVREKYKMLDLGKAKNRYFIMMAGVGLDAETVNDIGPVLKKLLGRGVYPFHALKKILTYAPSRLEIWLDDQVLPRWGYFAVIGNIKYYGGNIEIAQFAEPDDGYLDVCIFKRTDVINMFKYFISAASNGTTPLTEFADIEYFRVKKLKIKSKKPMLAHTDAETIGTTPLTIEAVPKAIRVICRRR
ncbi:diacylglycerol kinase family lipid kinase [Candidatus Woesearchaeota archaeon]|nr:diacylglycerol kinase family lipid kinase [Candidatus Woesearchaeota archaeon]